MTIESVSIEAGATTSLVTYLPEPGTPSHDASVGDVIRTVPSLAPPV